VSRLRLRLLKAAAYRDSLPAPCSRIGTGPSLCDRCAYADSLARPAVLSMLDAFPGPPGPAWHEWEQAARDAHTVPDHSTVTARDDRRRRIEAALDALPPMGA
jgi:hypothetical protein